MSRSANLVKCLALLGRFDWTYEMSDDHRCYSKGVQDMAACRHLYSNLTTVEKDIVKKWVTEHLTNTDMTSFYAWATNMVGA